MQDIITQDLSIDEMSEKESKIFLKIKEERKNSIDFYKDTRASGDTALKTFIGGKYQWETNGQDDDYRSSPNMMSRPALSINICTQFVRQFTNDLRNNFPSPTVIPLTEDGKKEAEIKEMRIRKIINQLSSKSAILQAADLMASRGEGYFRICREYKDDTSFEQDLYLEQIPDSRCVLWDSASYCIDRNDAMWVSLDATISRGEFENRFPKKRFMATNDMPSGDMDIWFAQGIDTMMICHHWEKEEEKVGMLYKVKRGKNVEVTKKPLKSDEILDERPILEKKIVYRIVCPYGILETSDWPSTYLPIVPVIGEQIDVEGKRILKGMVADLVDPQRMINVCESSIMEMIANAPNSPYVMSKKQIAGHEDSWANDPVQHKMYRLYNPDPDAPPPTREAIEPPIQALTQAANLFKADMRQITGIYDPSLGNKSNEISGVAIKERKLQGDMATYHLQDNFNLSMGLLGRILLDMFKFVHDTPQTIAIEHPDGKIEHVDINQPTKREGENVFYDFTKYDYDITIEVGATYKSRREEMAQQMKDLLSVDAQLMQYMGDLLVDNAFNKPEMTERMKFALAPQVQQYLAAKEQNKKPLDPMIAEELRQKDMRISMLSNALHELMDREQNESIKAQKDLTIKTMETQSRLDIAKYSNDTQVVLESMKHGHEAAHTLMQAEIDLTTQQMQPPLQVPGAPQKQPNPAPKSPPPQGGQPFASNPPSPPPTPITVARPGA